MIHQSKVSSNSALEDPYWNYRTLLIPMTGTAGATAFEDVSNSGVTVTTGGNAQADTTDPAFAGSSHVILDGTGDYLTIPNGAYMSTVGDFVCEFWFRMDSEGPSDAYYFVNNSAASSTFSIRYSNSANKIYVIDHGYQEVYTNEAPFTMGAWVHVLYSGRSSDNYTYLFINGVLAKSSNVPTRSTSPAAGTMTLGNGLLGAMCQFRFTRGISVSSNFSVPTAPYPQG
jgi:hypothetical protein